MVRNRDITYAGRQMTLFMFRCNHPDRICNVSSLRGRYAHRNITPVQTFDWSGKSGSWKLLFDVTKFSKTSLTRHMSFYLRNDQDKENQHTLCTYQIMMFFNALASLREPFETDLQITILLKFLFQSTISIINFLLSQI